MKYVRLLLIGLIGLLLVIILPCVETVRSSAKEVFDGIGVDVISNEDTNLG